jgi:hypothetical protein
MYHTHAHKSMLTLFLSAQSTFADLGRGAPAPLSCPQRLSALQTAQSDAGPLTRRGNQRFLPSKQLPPLSWSHGVA